MSWLENLTLNHLPFSLNWLPANTHLVGGAVRDALLNRTREYLDLDFVLPAQAIETARKIAQHYHAGFVVLDEQRKIARVVFKQGTVDFAQREGDTLETDLRRRDFTINAIAYNPFDKELRDPLSGLRDLEQGILRMISVANLEDDPLRLLRAYRQAAQLDFTIEPTTRATIATLSPLITKVAAERVKTELSYLLANPGGSYWLNAAWEDGLLQPWLKNTTREKLQQLAQVEQAVKLLQDILGETEVNRLIPDSQPLEMAKLALLVNSEPLQAELELNQLKYSRHDIRTVTTALKHLPRLLGYPEEIPLRDQYFWFLDVAEVFPVLAVLAVVLGINQRTITSLLRPYLNPQDQVAHPTPLVTGNDIMESLKLRPSPQIGKLLTEIQIARIEGKITTFDDALNFAQSIYQ